MLEKKHPTIPNVHSKDESPFWTSIKHHYPTETESLDTMIEELNRNTQKDQTIISKGMRITGDIELSTAMKHSGEIYGNVLSSHVVEIYEDARIEGDVKSSSLLLAFGSVTGNVHCQESIKTEGPSLITGNLKAMNIELSGQVEGKIEALKLVKLCKSAVVHGDIIASTIEVEEGALIYGHMIIQESKTQNFGFMDQSSFA